MFWWIISILSATTVGSLLYYYYRRLRTMMKLSSLLLKGMMRKTIQSYKHHIDIKHIDDLILINTEKGIIILPYDRNIEHKMINTYISLIGFDGKKRELKLYPGVKPLSLSPKRFGVKYIEIETEDDTIVLHDNQSYSI